MKETDVMLGDWVVCHGTYRRIQSLEFDNTEEEKCWFWSDEDNALCLLSEHDPIPITPEILEKNFQEFLPGINLMYQLKGPYCAMNEDGQWVFGLVNNNARFPLVKISFVHELQHALRLCGIEKEIII